MYLSSYKIICLRVTNLFAMPNYVFPLYIKLFQDVDQFVRNIHFPLFILYNQMFVICNTLFVAHYYLFDMFNFLFTENNYLFVLLKYLFPVFENNYLVLKKCFLKYHAKIVKCGLVLKILS